MKLLSIEFSVFFKIFLKSCLGMKSRRPIIRAILFIVRLQKAKKASRPFRYNLNKFNKSSNINRQLLPIGKLKR